mmetsp:Transcript_26223/g.42950  ORF Transcript_26223/g.42950 Transcript_26223/m.42950 type:complete len:89 (-) Transcript_26223:78-344(-)
MAHTDNVGERWSLVSRSADTEAYLASNPPPGAKNLNCLHPSTLLENTEYRLVWMSAGKILCTQAGDWTPSRLQCPPANLRTGLWSQLL